jgi:hypothetical protein
MHAKDPLGKDLLERLLRVAQLLVILHWLGKLMT